MAETLVLVPGMMCDGRAFWHQFMALSGDRPVMVAAALEGATVEDMAEQLLPALPERFALAGQGMGGNVALEIQRKAPERVTRLALMALSVQPERPEEAAAREERIVGAQVGRLAEVVAQELPPEHLAEGPGRAEIAGMLRDMALTLGEGVYVRQSRAMQRRPDQQKTLRKAMLPAVVICGAEDPVNSARRHEFMAEMLPYGRCEVVAGAGRLPSLEQPDAVTRIFDEWLAAPLLLR